MRIYILTHPLPTEYLELIDLNEGDLIFAVDKAVYDAVNDNVKLDLMMGDFDSFDATNIKNIKMLKLSPSKDHTDTYEAVKYAMSLNPNSVKIIGGLGGPRYDHHYGNLLLLKEFKNVEIFNAKNQIFTVENTSVNIKTNRYVSLFAFDEATVSLEGFEYPLKNYQLKFFDQLCISNKVIGEYGTIIVHEGCVIVYLSED